MGQPTPRTLDRPPGLVDGPPRGGGPPAGHDADPRRAGASAAAADVHRGVTGTGAHTARAGAQKCAHGRADPRISGYDDATEGPRDARDPSDPGTPALGGGRAMRFMLPLLARLCSTASATAPVAAASPMPPAATDSPMNIGVFMQPTKAVPPVFSSCSAERPVAAAASPASSLAAPVSSALSPISTAPIVPSAATSTAGVAISMMAEAPAAARPAPAAPPACVPFRAPRGTGRRWTRRRGTHPGPTFRDPRGRFFPEHNPGGRIRRDLPPSPSPRDPAPPTAPRGSWQW